MMLRAQPGTIEEKEFENFIILSKYDFVLSNKEWVKVKDLKIGDMLDDANAPIISIEDMHGKRKIFL